MILEKITSLEKSLSEIDKDFFKQVLMPYRTHATYLNRAFVESEPEKGIYGLVGKGEFSIPESCYIDDTGHFNAVEFNICYNQLGYTFLAHCIQHNLIPELRDYTIDTFLNKQLANFLIVRISSGFTKILNAKKFYGTWGINKVRKMPSCTFLNTYCNFHDDYDGVSKGEVTIGILPASSN